MAVPVDPTGSLIVELRDADVLNTLAAMTAGTADPKRVTGKRDQKAAPVVIVERMPSTRFPFGPGSGRLNIQNVLYAIKCVAARGPDGDIEAVHLAEVVADYLHMKGPRTRTIGGVGKVGIYISRVPSITQVLHDPDTDNPYVVVNASLEAAAQAVT